MPEKTIQQLNPEIPKTPEQGAGQEISHEIQPEQSQKAFQEKISQQVQAPLASDVSDDEKVKADARKIKNLDEKNQVEALANLALTKNPYHAIKTARSLGSAFVLDELHDKLVSDEFWKLLVEKGKLGEV